MGNNIEGFQSFSNNFSKIDKAIRSYIKYTLNTKEKINQHVPNTHIAAVFKDVLIYSELESKNEETFHKVEKDPVDSIGSNNPDNYIKLEDGRYLPKKTYNVRINDVLIPEYFDLKRLKKDGIEEIHRVYQKLREKKDTVRNNIKLGRIVLPYEYVNRALTNSYKIKTK